MNKSKMSGGAALIVAFFTIFMAIMTFNLIVFPACALDTMGVYGVGQKELTTLASVTSVVGLFGGLLFGPILDKKGSRKTILVSMIIGVVFFYIRAFTTAYMLVVVLTFLASLFIGVCQVSAAKVLDTWFTKENVAVAFSFQAGGAGIGSASAFVLGGMLGLHNSLLLIAILYTLLTLMWVAVGKDGPIKPAAMQAPPKDGLKIVYKSSYLWLLAIACSCAVGSTLLINTYCINAFIGKGLDPSKAALMGTVINLSLCVGGYVGTWIMGVVKRYNLCTILFFGVGCAGYLLAWFTPLGTQTWIFMIVGCVLQGNAIGLQSGRTPLVPLTGQYPQECIATAAGALETIKGVITFVFPIAVSAAFGTNFSAIFITFAVVEVIGIICGAVLMPELGPKGELQKKAMEGK